MVRAKGAKGGDGCTAEWTRQRSGGVAADVGLEAGEADKRFMPARVIGFGATCADVVLARFMANGAGCSS